MNNLESGKLKPKTIVLIIGVILMLIGMLLPDFITLRSNIEQVYNLGFAVVMNLLLVFWCSFDSDERNEKLSSGMIFLIVIFGIFAILYYLFRTRGFKNGLFAVGKLLLLFLGLSITYAVILLISEVFH